MYRNYTKIFFKNHHYFLEADPSHYITEGQHFTFGLLRCTFSCTTSAFSRFSEVVHCLGSAPEPRTTLEDVLELCAASDGRAEGTQAGCTSRFTPSEPFFFHKTENARSSQCHTLCQHCCWHSSHVCHLSSISYVPTRKGSTCSGEL